MTHLGVGGGWVSSKIVSKSRVMIHLGMGGGGGGSGSR